MFSKSLIQFSVDGQGCVPSLLLDLRPNHGGGNEGNGDLLQKVPCCTQCPQPCSRALPETPRHSWACLGQSVLGSLLLSPGSCCAQGSVCALQESVSPVLCNFWWLCGGVNGNLFQEDLCNTQVCCTQSPSSGGKALLTRTSAEDTQTEASMAQSLWGLLVYTRFCLSPLSVSGRYGV